MADFALGLTKTAVEGTLNRVKLVIEEEAELKEKVQQDLVFITGEFEMMQSFLKVANVKGDQSVVARTWVRQLRTLAFDVEDCVDYVVHLDIESPWTWLRRLWRTVYCQAPPLALDMAIVEIRQLKARVEDVSLRNTRYSLMSDSSSKHVPAASVTEKLNAGASGFHRLREVWEDNGRRRGVFDIHNFISCQGSDLQVISIWGSTGCDLGRTSIFRKAYYDPKICKEFKSRAWVKLEHPFSSGDFANSLLTQFHATSHQEKTGVVNFETKMKAEVTQENLMKDGLMQQLREQRYLIVLEDVFTMAEWDVIRMFLPESNNGSRVVMSTPQLGVALLCTGEPYQVSELRQFSDDQFLCAFYKKGRSDMGEFKWQLKCGGVMSVWGDESSILVCELYKGILNRWKEFDGVEFERHSWVDVPIPFKPIEFAQRLFLNLHSDDIRVREIAAVGGMRESDLIQWCCRFLLEEDYLVVINDLQSMDDWDSIICTFFPLKQQPIKGCILVSAWDPDLATYCAKDDKEAHGIVHLKEDAFMGTFIKQYCPSIENDNFIPSIEDFYRKHQDCPCCHPQRKSPAVTGFSFYEPGGKKGRLFSTRRKEDALDWTKRFKLVGREYKTDELVGKIMKSQAGSSVIPVYGCAGVGKSALVRDVYYRTYLGCEGFSDSGFISYSWVDVPHPFDLIDFSWRLLLDFYSDDIRAKESAAVRMMQGQDPVEECRKFIREQKCFVVIDGLCNPGDWLSIRDTFLSSSDTGQSTIIVTTTCTTVVLFCDPGQERRLDVFDIRIDDFKKVEYTEEKLQKYIQKEDDARIIPGIDKRVTITTNWSWFRHHANIH